MEEGCAIEQCRYCGEGDDGSGYVEEFDDYFCSDDCVFHFSEVFYAVRLGFKLGSKREIGVHYYVGKSRNRNRRKRK